MTTPGATALLDQLAAAAAEAVGHFTALGERLGAEVGPAAGPGMRAVIDGLQERVLRSRITLCRHLAWERPAPAYWVPGRPGRLRCPGCLAGAALAILGTREDATCDGCGSWQPGKLWPAAVQLPAVPDLLIGGRLRHLPPITVTTGFCDACAGPR